MRGGLFASKTKNALVILAMKMVNVADVVFLAVTDYEGFDRIIDENVHASGYSWTGINFHYQIGVLN